MHRFVHRAVRRGAAHCLAGLALAACVEDATRPDPGSRPTLLAAAVEANPVNTISAVARVAARDADAALVRFWREGGPVDASPPYPFAGGTEVRVPVLGLDTVATYAIEILLARGDSAFAADTLTFTTGVLPAWIPAAVPLGGDTTPGLLALSYPHGPVIVNNAGRVVWYAHAPDPTLVSFQAHADGRYTLLGPSDTGRRFHVLDELGQEVRTLECVGYLTRFHDVLVVADGSAWILCDETRTMDLTAYGGRVDAQVTWTVVQHLAADGSTVLFEWHAADHFDISDVPPQDLGGTAVNATHGNGVVLDADGNLLLSFRTLNEVTKVDVATGAVIWRFGGRRNEFTLVNDAKGFFERQHGVQRAGPGMIQLLDNGTAGASRFVRYQLNPTTGTALLVMDFRDGLTATPVGGSTQYYTTGYGLVSFGRAGRVIEVDPVGNRAWELTGIDGAYVFRAQRLNSLYPPGLGRPVPAPQPAAQNTRAVAQ